MAVAAVVMNDTWCMSTNLCDSPAGDSDRPSSCASGNGQTNRPETNKKRVRDKFNKTADNYSQSSSPIKICYSLQKCSCVIYIYIYILQCFNEGEGGIERFDVVTTSMGSNIMIGIPLFDYSLCFYKIYYFKNRLIFFYYFQIIVWSSKSSKYIPTRLQYLKNRLLVWPKGAIDNSQWPISYLPPWHLMIIT